MPRFFLDPNPEAYRAGNGRALSSATASNPRLAAELRDRKFMFNLIHNTWIPLRVEVLKRQLELGIAHAADPAVLHIACYELQGKAPEFNETREEPEYLPFGKDDWIPVGRCVEFIAPDSYYEEFICPFKKAEKIVADYETEDDFVESWETSMEIIEAVDDKRELVVPKEWSGLDSDLTYVLDVDCFRSFWKKAQNRVQAVEFVKGEYSEYWSIASEIVARGNAKRQRRV